MKKIHYTLFFVFILFTQTQTLLAGPGYFSWKGAISTAWSNPANWAPNGVPSSGDTILYDPTSGTYSLTLDSNKTVNLFTILSGTLDISTKTLTITGTALFGGGQISNGHLVVSNSSSVTFSGTTFSSVVNITCNSIYLNGSTFNDSLSITKNGSSNDNSKGHNTYNKYVALTNTYKGSIVLSDSFPDTFNKILAVKNTFESGFIYLAHRATGNTFNDNVIFTGRNIYSNYYGTADYKGNIILNCPNGEVCFGTSTGSCTLANAKVIALGDSAFSAGRLVLKNFTKLGTDGVTSLTLTGSASMNFVSSVFNTDVTVVAPSVNVQSTRFLANCSLTKSGSGTQTSIGGNYFGGIATIVNNHSSGTFTLGSTTVDTFALGATIKNQSGTLQINNAQFNDTVRIINTESSTTNDRLYFANTGTVRFKKSVTIQNSGSGLCFGNANGATQLDSARTLTFVGSILGNITLQHFNQVGPGSQSINFPNDGSKLILGPNSTFNANFTYYGKNVSLNGVTFNAAASITKYGIISDTCAGGNVFNGSTVIKDSLAATHKFILAYTTADDYNGNVTFVQKGTGAAMYPSYTKNSTFAANITVDASSAFQFGVNGGKVILDGTGNQILSNLSSGTMTMKKLQLNKASNSFTLSSPLAISDSLMLTKGWINTDTTNLLSLVNGSKLSGGSDSSYINGPLKKTGIAAFVFPTGSSALAHPFHPLEITAPSSSSDAYTANYFSSGQNIGTAIDTSIDNLNSCQYWKLNRNSGTSKVKVKLSWNHDSCETISPNNFRVAGWNGTLWKDLGNFATTGDSVQGTVQSLDSLNSVMNLTLAFRKCSAFRKTVAVTNVRCKGGSDGTAVINAKGGTAGYSYLWAKGIGANSFTRNLRAGKYYFQTSDSRGCSISDSILVHEPDSISLNATFHSSDCGYKNGSIQLYPNGGVGPYRYYWSYNSSKSYRIEDIPAGKYFVTVTDTNGCRTSNEFFIGDNDGPGMNVINQTNLNCFGGDEGSVEVEGADGKSPFKYQWAKSNADSSFTINSLSAGFYPVQITNTVGCITFDTVEITQPDTFGVSFQVTNTPCGNSTGQIIATPYGGNAPYFYSWMNLLDTDSIISNLSVGMDSLFVTDVNGCLLRRGVEVLSSSGFSVNSEVLSNVICFPDSGGSARVIVSGGTFPYTFEWSPMGGSNDTAAGLLPGNYIITAVDANGCKQKSTLSITSNPHILANLYPISPSDQWSSNGYIESFATGGLAPYQYLWGDSSTNSSLINLPIGKYSVRITDQNGCMIIQEMTLNAGTINCFECSPIHESCIPYYTGTPPCSTCTGQVVLNIEDFGANGSDDLSDECAFEEAAHYLSLCNPNAIKMLNIPSGTYYVGYQEGTDSWLKLGATVFCLEGINNLTITGDVLSSKPIIRFNECMRYGAFIENEATNTDDRFLSDFPGRLINCVVTGNTVTTSDNISWMTVGNIIYDADPNDVFLSGGVRRSFFPGTYISAILSPNEFTIVDAPFRNGNFKLLVQTDCKVEPVIYHNIASMGQMFHFRECNDITINFLELDGNMDNVVIGGGYYNDGIQVDYDGIVVNACNNLTINKVDIHHFGHDGLWINYMSDALCPPGPQSSFMMNCNIYNTTSRYNGRNALSWTGGNGLSVYDSDFSFTGQSRLVSQPGAGMDIEYELSNNPNSNGYFQRTSFRYNKNHGIICDAQAHGVAHISRNYTFGNCTFIGSENGDAAWPNSRNFQFQNNCQFVGKVWNPFPVVASSSLDPIYFDNTKFLGCSFSEEYDETDPDVPTEFLGKHYFSFTPEETEIVGGTRVVRTYCGGNGINTGIGEHQAMVDFYNASRVSLENCTLRTNLTNKLLNLGLGVLVMPLNYNVMDHCYFESRGLNFIVSDVYDNCTCDQEIIRFRNTTLLNINSCLWIGPTRPDPTGLSPNPCGSIPWTFASYVDWPLVQGGGNLSTFPRTDGFGVFWDGNYLGTNVGTLCPKFRDRVDPNSVMPLYSTPCQDIPIGYPNQCSQSQRHFRTAHSTKDSETKIFPNPVISDLFLNDLVVGSEYSITDLMGKIIVKDKVFERNKTINLSFLAPGLYLININGSTPNKIVKQ